MLESPGTDELYFLPLGGTGEIGMNLNLYGHAGQWLMIDLGITFNDGKLPGVDVIMPDPSFIVERRDRLAGLVLTHGHEDHIGAVPYLWSRLRCPIYATAFTAALVRGKLEEAGLAGVVEMIELPLSGRHTIGPFELELVTLTHSIPEPNAVVLRTAAGTVLHTGDWKLDPEPQVGATYDEARLRALADEGVLAMVCDSTNALVYGQSGSEASVKEALMDLVGELEQRVAVTCFASNVARLKTIGAVARAHKRQVALVGRSMKRIVEIAKETGYLDDFPKIVSELEAASLPRRKVLLLLTGSQGERRSALWRIANDEHPDVRLDPGDAVIFSSRVIPGNEVSIFDLENELVRRQLRVISAETHPIHVSGHPARDELAAMYQWVRPEIAVPTHGEPRHLVEHARLAAECQVPQQVVAANGALVRLAPGRAAVVGEVPSGRLALDGNRLRPVDSPVLRTRQKMIFSGAAVATLVLDRHGELCASPQVTTHGLFDAASDADDLATLAEEVEDAFERLSDGQRRDDAKVKDAARSAVRRLCFRLLGKKPVTEVQLLRLP
ncbi:MAG: ribonuclease J [Kiloniellales bacterium]